MADIGIGRRISAWLAYRRISQAEFAAILNMSRSTVSYWCTDSRYPSRESLQAILRALRTTTAKFFGPLPPRS